MHLYLLRILAVMLSVTGICEKAHAESQPETCRRDTPVQKTVWEADSMWYNANEEYDSEKIDVLYFVSTNVLEAKDEEGNEVWQTRLTPTDRHYLTKEIAWVKKNMFYGDFNLSAPYYHQYTFNALCKLSKKQYETVYKKVAREACEAFDYYMAHRNNGRPFILAGFSQGAILTLDILRHMTDEQYSRLVACYTIGYRLSANDLKHPHINAAQGETDRGVVVSFNSTQSAEGIWQKTSDGAATCINPVNWHTDATPATFTFKGATNTVSVNPEYNVLFVKVPDATPYYEYYKKAPFGKVGVHHDNLHHWDLLFYPHFIHDNALKRFGK